MTICLAAIAKKDSKEYIIFSTDHMVSTNMGQFEHSIKKYKKINGKTIAMLAGNPLLFEDLTKIRSCNLPYEDIKKEIFENFGKKREENLRREVLDMFGIEKRHFLEALQRKIENPVMESILKNIAEYTLQTSILLIGFNESNEAQITEIGEVNYADFRVINFHAIGSGNSQAINALLFHKHDKQDELLPTIYSVFKAKKNAEVLQGVGRETDVGILCSDGTSKILSPEDLNILERVYLEELRYGRSHNELSKINMEV